MIKAVLFDFDDTLGDREVYAYRMYEELLSPYTAGLAEVEAEAVIQKCLIWDQFGNTNKNYVQEQIRKAWGFELNYELDQYWDDNLWRHAVLFSGTEDVLHALKKNFLVGIITNGKPYGQRMKIEKTGIDSLMDTVLISGEENCAKPDPEIFRRAAGKLHVSPEECVYVGDAYFNDILGAERAGMTGIWKWPHGKRLCMAKTLRISDLAELPTLIDRLNQEEKEHE